MCSLHKGLKCFYIVLQLQRSLSSYQPSWSLLAPLNSSLSTQYAQYSFYRYIWFFSSTLVCDHNTHHVFFVWTVTVKIDVTCQFIESVAEEVFYFFCHTCQCVMSFWTWFSWSLIMRSWLQYFSYEIPSGTPTIAIISLMNIVVFRYSFLMMSSQPQLSASRINLLKLLRKLFRECFLYLVWFSELRVFCWWQESWNVNCIWVNSLFTVNLLWCWAYVIQR